MKPKPSLLASRIRRVMLADEEVGKIAAPVPGLIGEKNEMEREMKARAGQHRVRASDNAPHAGGVWRITVHVQECVRCGVWSAWLAAGAVRMRAGVAFFFLVLSTRPCPLSRPPGRARGVARRPVLSDTQHYLSLTQSTPLNSSWPAS
jgi:hypothetical protein